jgi:hypothetical protein
LPVVILGGSCTTIICTPADSSSLYKIEHGEQNRNPAFHPTLANSFYGVRK